MFQFILPFFSSLLITAFATPLCILLAKKLNLIDDPKTHKHPAILHKKPIPRAGGIALFVGIWLVALFFVPHTMITLALFAASFISLIVGVIDDKYDISRYLRFGINIICAIIVVASGVTIPFITHPFGGILHLNTIKIFAVSASDILAVIWIVWVMNMLNWSKGVDGQMPGVVAIASFVIGLLALRFPIVGGDALIAANLSFIIAGAAIGFLIFNFYPARIFPGYSATAMYLLLASVSMLSGVKLATAILVMGIPMIDGIFTILRRLYQKKSPFRGDRRHLHHLLLDRGFNQRKVALFYWTVSAILGVTSLLLTSKGKLFAIIMLVVIVTGGLLFLHLTRSEDV